MARRRPSIVGTCNVCGTHGELTDDHVPPQKAFNDRPYLQVPGSQGWELGPVDPSTAKKVQGGVALPTLCGRCNNLFGSWYARAYVDWCYEGVRILRAAQGTPLILSPVDIYPLRVIKQIVAMFFTINGPEFRTKEVGDWLVRWLLNKEQSGMHPDVAIYAYYNTTGDFRYRSFGAIGNLYSGKARFVTELTFPPFGFVLSLDSPAPEAPLLDITSFAYFDHQRAYSVYLSMPHLPTHLSIAMLDYRTRDEIEAEARRSDDAAIRDTERDRLEALGLVAL